MLVLQGDTRVYRHSHEKTLRWLRKKVRLVAVVDPMVVSYRVTICTAVEACVLVPLVLIYGIPMYCSTYPYMRLVFCC